MAIKKTQLYNHLWETANALRGGMDATHYKDYVLRLLFVKYVSDRYKGNPYADFVVPDGGSFDDLVEAKGKSDIGERINKVLSKLAEANELKGVIDKVDFDDESKLGKGKEKVDRLTKLIGVFENPELNFSKNRADGDDILGDVYEYFMKKFATEAGKSKGQFYTPAEVSRVMAKIIGVENATSPEQSAYDPTCGSGSLLLKVADEAPVDITLYGQEVDIDVANLARMNMIMHGRPDAEIAQGNTLSSPKFLDENGKLKTFDFAVSNPPFSQKNWMNGVDPENDPYRRFEFGIPPSKNGDYAFLLHLIKSLKSKGKGAIILPHGVLFRGNAEAKIRRQLIERGYIKGIIGLPPNLFYGTGIPAIIMVIDKENAGSRKGIFMIDASRGFRKDGAKNRLRERDIHKIVKTFRNFDEIPGYSRMVSIEEIKKNDYNLNIPRYIESTEEEGMEDIHAHLHGGIPGEEVERIESLRNFKNLRVKLFSEREEGYCALNVDVEDLQDMVESDEEVRKFKNRVLKVFELWAEEQEQFMKGIGENTSAKKFIEMLGESILQEFTGENMIDAYGMYQILMDYWDEEMKDDVYIVIEKGWNAKPYRVIEKKNGKKKDKGWTCDLLPKEIVINEFFKEDKEDIERLEEKKDEIERKMQELVEDNSGEEGIFEEVKNEKGNITKKEIKSMINELRWNPEFKDDVLLLHKYLALMDELSRVKREIKEREKELDEKLLRKYPEFSEEEVKELVVKKKWIARLEDRVRDEVDDIILDMVMRIKELEENYETPLPEIEREVDEYEKKVKEHLKMMGFEI